MSTEDDTFARFDGVMMRTVEELVDMHQPYGTTRTLLTRLEIVGNDVIARAGLSVADYGLRATIRRHLVRKYGATFGVGHRFEREEGRQAAAAGATAWLELIPARMVPRRVQTEVIGDGLERIDAVVRGGGSKWAVRAVKASVFLAVVGEIVRYWARAIKGEKASK